MNFLEFIFKLLLQFINFPPGRFTELQDKAMLWRTNVMADVDGPNAKWYHKILKYDNEWWFQVLLAISFLFAFKSVRSWLAESPLSEEDGEEVDGEDATYQAKQQARQAAAPWAKF